MRRVTPAFGLAIATLAGLTVAALSAPPDGLPTTNSQRPEKPVTKTWAVYDAKGHRIGSQKWRVTAAGGNCCEVLVTAARSGRLVEFGGTYPIYSDDEGRTWHEIAPIVPSDSRLPVDTPRTLAGGEGTVVMAPGGDILGVGWDPYSGDHLQSFYFNAKAKTWQYQEAPLHEPFYDREWNAVAKGPFTIGGQTVPWLGLVLSAHKRIAVLLSTDGLNYVVSTQRDVDAARTPAVKAYLPTTPDPDLDYMQQPEQTGLGTLAKGILSFDEAATCTVQTLTNDGSWACFSLPNEEELTGPLHTDSRGWVHELVDEKGDLTYRMSKDGGRRWYDAEFTVPFDLVPETYDFKVNGKLGLAVYAAHAKTDDGSYQDVVMTWDVHTTTPKLKKVYLVGDGNLKSSVGLSVADTVTNTINNTKSNRVDFTSVAILPNGHIAVSFADKTYDDPALAVLM